VAEEKYDGSGQWCMLRVCAGFVKPLEASVASLEAELETAKRVLVDPGALLVFFYFVVS
jgi:hypothetical protein